MKEITAHFQPVEPDFRNEIENYVQKRKYIGIHYFTEIREYISTTAIIKEIYTHPDGEFMRLSTGEEIRLDRVVRLNGNRAPGYDIDDFTCDC